MAGTTRLEPAWRSVRESVSGIAVGKHVGFARGHGAPRLTSVRTQPPEIHTGFHFFRFDSAGSRAGRWRVFNRFGGKSLPTDARGRKVCGINRRFRTVTRISPSGVLAREGAATPAFGMAKSLLKPQNGLNTRRWRHHPFSCSERCGVRCRLERVGFRAG